MAKWVVQNNALDLTQADAVAKAVLASGGKVFGAKVIPFTDTIEFWDGEEPTGPDVVPYGSTKLTQMAFRRSWGGVFFNQNFDTDLWNQHRDDMLNGDSLTMTVEEAIQHFTGEFAEKHIFIRPREGMKVFAGGAMTVGDIRNWEKSPAFGNFQIKADTQVSFAPVKQIDAETRWFIVNGKVIDGSIYRLRGQRIMIHEKSQTNIDQAQSLADKWLPIHTCVMDTAETPDGIRVIEFNCFNSSGFYNNDIGKVIHAVNTMLDSTEGTKNE